MKTKEEMAKALRWVKNSNISVVEDYFEYKEERYLSEGALVNIIFNERAEERNSRIKELQSDIYESKVQHIKKLNTMTHELNILLTGG